jgi:hypothetical protein
MVVLGRLDDFEDGARVTKAWTDTDPRCGRVCRIQDEDGEHIGIFWDGILDRRGGIGPWDGGNQIVEFPPDSLFKRVDVRVRWITTSRPVMKEERW